MLRSRSIAHVINSDRPAAPTVQQQRRFCWHGLHAPVSHRTRAFTQLLAASSTLQDLEIKPYQPTEQQTQQPDSSSTNFAIPPVSEWATNEVLLAGCEPSAAPLRVAVLVSGGVDSSLALQLVAAAGHKPTAFYLQIWFQEDFRNFWDSCPWEEDLDYAKKVCDALGIPLVVVPLTQQYWDRVVSHSVAEIKAGRTPNPDMLCNSRVKFGAFVEYLETEYAGQLDRIASGHYARMITLDQYQQQHQQLGHDGQQQQHEEPSPVDWQLSELLASHHQASSSNNSSSSTSQPVHDQPSSSNSSSPSGHHPASSSSSQPCHHQISSSGSSKSSQPAHHQASSSSSSSQPGRHQVSITSSSSIQPGYRQATDTRSTSSVQPGHDQAGSSSSSQPGGPRYLCLTPDAVKDQTYFLAQLSAAQLARCMFPLGGFTKPQVRALATAAGLATSGRKDSQGICFLGKVKFSEFVKEHLGEWPGPLVEQESGEVVGVHSGYWFYTVGQRGGVKLPGGPWYVTAKDMTQNVVYVSRSYYDADKRRDAFVCGPFNWLSELRPQRHRPLFVKVRHGPNMAHCHLHLGPQQAILSMVTDVLGSPAAAGSTADGATSTPLIPQWQQQGFSSSLSTAEAVSLQDQDLHGMVVLSENDQGLAAGQYAVFYQDGVCLGSAQMLGTVFR